MVHFPKLEKEREREKKIIMKLFCFYSNKTDLKSRLKRKLNKKKRLNEVCLTEIVALAQHVHLMVHVPFADF